jgi:hypothetical protein
MIAFGSTPSHIEMTDILDQRPAIVLFFGLGLILLALCVIISWTTRISFRINKLEPPGSQPQFAAAFLQIMLGVITLMIVRTIKNEPLISIGSGLAITLLSELFVIKWMFKKTWKQALRLWAAAAALQLVTLPVGSVVMLLILVTILNRIYPPQY